MILKTSWAKVPLGKSTLIYTHIHILYTEQQLSHSEVHKARNKFNGQMVALKRILMHNEKEGVSG